MSNDSSVIEYITVPNQFSASFVLSKRYSFLPGVRWLREWCSVMRASPRMSRWRGSKSKFLWIESYFMRQFQLTSLMLSLEALRDNYKESKPYLNVTEVSWGHATFQSFTLATIACSETSGIGLLSLPNLRRSTFNILRLEKNERTSFISCGAYKYPSIKCHHTHQESIRNSQLYIDIRRPNIC